MKKRIYSKTILPPTASMASLIFSASSLVTPSLSTLGAASTNFLDSTKLNPRRFLTSLMILGLLLASKDSSFKVKMVFSLGASSAGASSAAAAGAGAAPAAGKEISGMSNLVLSSLTKEAVSKRVSLEMSSTMALILGSTGAAAASVELNRRAI